MKKAWERQPTETPKAWEAFKFYRDMGITRSLSKINKEHFGNSSGKHRQLETWSPKYHWVKRCEAWDEYEDELLIKENLAEKKKMNKRHARMGLAMQEKGNKFLKEKTDARDASISDVVKLQSDGIKIERIARGESSEVVELAGMSLIVNYPKDFKKKTKNK